MPQIVRLPGSAAIDLVYSNDLELPGRRRGFAVRNRVDGTRRLMFDFYVPDRPRGTTIHQELKECFPRRIAVEFDLALTEMPGSSIAVLVSRRSWNRLVDHHHERGSPEWPTFSDLFAVSVDPTVWNGWFVRRSEMMLGRPTPLTESATHDPKCPIKGGLGLIDLDEDVCLINHTWLNTPVHCGIVILEAEFTCFFPRNQ